MRAAGQYDLAVAHSCAVEFAEIGARHLPPHPVSHLIECVEKEHDFAQPRQMLKAWEADSRQPTTTEVINNDSLQ